jgi:hypothetical protein
MVCGGYAPIKSFMSLLENQILSQKSEKEGEDG